MSAVWSFVKGLFSSAVGTLVPLWARWLMILGVLLAAAAFGAVKMHEQDDLVLDKERAEASSFKDHVALLGTQAKLAALKTEQLNAQNAKEKQDEAQAQIDALKSQLGVANAAVARLRSVVAGTSGVNTGGSLVPGQTTRAGLPAGTVCYDGGKLSTGLSAALGRFRSSLAESAAATAERDFASVQGCSTAVIELRVAKEWAKGITAP